MQSSSCNMKMSGHEAQKKKVLTTFFNAYITFLLVHKLLQENVTHYHVIIIIIEYYKIPKVSTVLILLSLEEHQVVFIKHNY